MDSHLRVAGWVENIRDHGGVSFVDLRDMYGVLQVVMRDTTLLEGLSKSAAGLSHRGERDVELEAVLAELTEFKETL